MYKIPNITIPPMIPLEELREELNEEKVKHKKSEWYLEEIAGPHGNVEMKCDRSLIFGRAARNCNVVFPIDISGVSKIHCEVVPTKDGLLLKDLNSTYGTFLIDGRRVQPDHGVLLEAGDVFYLASKEIMFKVR